MSRGRAKLRVYALIDQMQPQYTAFIGTVSKGSVPTPGMAQLLIEVGPASRTFELLDTAVKSSNVLPAFLIVEREYGTLELHSESVAEVNTAGQRILEELGRRAIANPSEYCHLSNHNQRFTLPGATP